jgi:hypothetical protein
MQPMGRDPVSGNNVPPGAMPSEVRDDVDIKASEGEFVVPADVVRFLGLEKLEGLVNKAKESLAQMQQNGRIGGKPAPQQPPREAPMPLPQGGTPSQPMGGPPRPPGMAEGGVVAQPATGSPAPAMQAYEGPDGRMVYIPFVNGQPLTPIPAGYRPASAVRQAIQPDRGNRSGGSFFNAVGGMRANTPTSPQEWSVDEFINYGQQLQSGVPDAVTRGVGMILPFSNILFGLAERNMQNTVPGMIDNMIETGVDSQGNPLTDEQREGLLNTRNVMGERMAQERGDRFNPFESLSNLVGRLTGGSNQPSGQRQNNSMSTPSASQSRSSVAPTQAPASGSTPSMSASGQMTVTPDKEEKDMGTKSFAYGGLVTNQPKNGFMKKYGDPTANRKQPVIGGAPMGSGFTPRNKKQPIIGG